MDAVTGLLSSFAPSTAFKRVRGISPREHRMREASRYAPVVATNPWRRLPA